MSDDVTTENLKDQYLEYLKGRLNTIHSFNTWVDHSYGNNNFTKQQLGELFSSALNGELDTVEIKVNFDGNEIV